MEGDDFGSFSAEGAAGGDDYGDFGAFDDDPVAAPARGDAPAHFPALNLSCTLARHRADQRMGSVLLAFDCLGLYCWPQPARTNPHIYSQYYMQHSADTLSPFLMIIDRGSGKAGPLTRIPGPCSP